MEHNLHFEWWWNAFYCCPILYNILLRPYLYLLNSSYISWIPGSCLAWVVQWNDWYCWAYMWCHGLNIHKNGYVVHFYVISSILNPFILLLWWVDKLLRFVDYIYVALVSKPSWLSFIYWCVESWSVPVLFFYFVFFWWSVGSHIIDHGFYLTENYHCRRFNIFTFYIFHFLPPTYLVITIAVMVSINVMDMPIKNLVRRKWYSGCLWWWYSW